jgi:hypothetical protein
MQKQGKKHRLEYDHLQPGPLFTPTVARIRDRKGIPILAAIGPLLLSKHLL